MFSLYAPCGPKIVLIKLYYLIFILVSTVSNSSVISCLQPIEEAKTCVCFIVFNATFSNISAISWRPVLVVEESGVPGENH